MDDIFPEARDRIKQGRCGFCGQPVDRERLRDELSKVEFDISGMCQRCQDDVFGNN